MCYDLVTTPNHGKEVFLINSIAQESRYRLSVLQYANRYSVTQIARVYRCNHQFVYLLRWRYNGTSQSLHALILIPGIIRQMKLLSFARCATEILTMG